MHLDAANPVRVGVPMVVGVREAVVEIGQDAKAEGATQTNDVDGKVVPIAAKVAEGSLDVIV